jgi:hypothetical protein
MISAAAHLVWLGPRLGVLGYLTIRSALDRGGFQSVTLHHDEAGLMHARPGAADAHERALS